MFRLNDYGEGSDLYKFLSSIASNTIYEALNEWVQTPDACLHNCPKKAIHLPVEKADARFRNEHVSLNDIIRSNE